MQTHECVWQLTHMKPAATARATLNKNGKCTIARPNLGTALGSIEDSRQLHGAAPHMDWGRRAVAYDVGSGGGGEGGGEGEGSGELGDGGGGEGECGGAGAGAVIAELDRLRRRVRLRRRLRSRASKGHQAAPPGRLSKPSRGRSGTGTVDEEPEKGQGTRPFGNGFGELWVLRAVRPRPEYSQCLPHLWYLSNDMQFYLCAPLLVFPSCTRRRVRRARMRLRPHEPACLPPPPSRTNPRDVAASRPLIIPAISHQPAPSRA